MHKLKLTCIDQISSRVIGILFNNSFPNMYFLSLHLKIDNIADEYNSVPICVCV